MYIMHACEENLQFSYENYAIIMWFSYLLRPSIRFMRLKLILDGWYKHKDLFLCIFFKRINQFIFLHIWYRWEHIDPVELIVYKHVLTKKIEMIYCFIACDKLKKNHVLIKYMYNANKQNHIYNFTLSSCLWCIFCSEISQHFSISS